MRAGLDHVHLFASDVAATVGFFRTMFGATVVWDEEAAGVRNVRLDLLVFYPVLLALSVWAFVAILRASGRR